MGTMKSNGVHDLFRLHDIRRYPVFYIELSYVVFTLLGVGLIVADGISNDVGVPPGTAPAWEAAASYMGIALLMISAAGIALVGLYGLFKGGYKWRARHMFAQFIIRLYAVIGTISVNGWYPITWVASFMLVVVAAIIYLKLRWEDERWKAFITDA
jgi:hypothetical protein